MDDKAASTQPPPKHPSKARAGWAGKVFAILIIALMLLALAAIYMRYKQHLKDTISPYKPVTAISSFSYKTLTDVTVKGENGSLTFKKPGELEKVAQTKNPVSMDFAKFSGPDGLLPYISYLSAESLPSNDARLESGLASAASAGHNPAMDSLTDFINHHKIGYYGTPVISAPSALTVQGGKAWSARFTLSAVPAALKVDHPANIPQAQAVKGAPTIPNPSYEGRVVVAFGKSAIYYFMVYDLSPNWQANQNIWEQVINSLKID